MSRESCGALFSKKKKWNIFSRAKNSGEMQTSSLAFLNPHSEEHSTQSSLKRSEEGSQWMWFHLKHNLVCKHLCLSCRMGFHLSWGLVYGTTPVIPCAALHLYVFTVVTESISGRSSKLCLTVITGLESATRSFNLHLLIFFLVAASPWTTS